VNQLPANLITGTAGELLVQLRLFQYGVQAAPPLKDSGNDLIAVRGQSFRAVQIKTTGSEDNTWAKGALDREFHVLALVRLRGEGTEYLLDKCDVFLYCKDECAADGWPDIENHRISQAVVDSLFTAAQCANRNVTA
jgi:hypothetical protein